MTITCPKCRCSIGLRPDFEEGKVRCPKCRSKLQVAPGGEAQAASSSVNDESSTAVEEECKRVEIGDTVGGCRMEEMLGAGAMGLVYRATQLSLDRQVAVKLLPSRFASQPLFVSRFDSESAALAALNHANIVSIIDRGCEDGTYYFVMEYVQGRTLHAMLREGQLSNGQIFQIMEQMLSALSYAQRQGIVHRDIKPRNIMINDQGRVKIADFGLAFLMGAGDTKGERYGTKGYMAPEQRRGDANIDGRADLYAAAVVLYEMLVGEKPDDSHYVEPSQAREGLSAAIDYVLCRGLQEEPDKRYQNPVEMLADIRMSTGQRGSFLAPCPQCGTHNEPERRECANCQADLADLFDACPQCQHENRCDMGKCAQCEFDIKEHRRQLWKQIIHVRKAADACLEQARLDEAAAELEKLKQLPGREFRKVAVAAETLVERLLSKRGDVLLSVKEKAVRLCSQHKYGEALMILESIAKSGIDVSTEVALAKKRMDKRLKLSDAGDARWRDGDVAGALKAYEKALAIWPDNDLLAENVKKAKKAAKLAEEKQTLIERAEAQLKAKQFDEAQRICSGLIESWPDAPGLTALLERLRRAQAFAEAGQALQAGVGFAKAKKWSDAAREFARAEQACPDGATLPGLADKLAEARARAKKRMAIIAGSIAAAVAVLVVIIILCGE